MIRSEKLGTGYPCLSGSLLPGPSSPPRRVGGQQVGSGTAGTPYPPRKTGEQTDLRSSSGFQTSRSWFCKRRSVRKLLLAAAANHQNTFPLVHSEFPALQHIKQFLKLNEQTKIFFIMNAFSLPHLRANQQTFKRGGSLFESQRFRTSLKCFPPETQGHNLMFRRRAHLPVINVCYLKHTYMNL